MANNMNYKEQYTYGLNLLKKDLLEFENDKLYNEIVKYFTYPISLLEEETRKTIECGADTEEYYAMKCDEINKLYHRLVMTVACTSNKRSLIDKIKKHFEKPNISICRK